MLKKYFSVILLIACTNLFANADQKLKLVIKIADDHVFSDLASPIKKILEEKYEVSFSDKGYNVLFEGAGHWSPELKKRDFMALVPPEPNVVKIFWTQEAILPNLDSYDLTIGFNRIESPKYIRFPLHYSYAFGKKIRIDYNRESDLGTCNSNKKYFACFLVTSHPSEDNYRNHKPFDGCKARLQLFEKLSLYKKVASGGRFANNIGKNVDNAMEWLSDCKFVIAYENQTWEGYITEKPFQAYFAGAVPIYYADEGKDTIKELNKKSIIFAKDFNNDDQLIEYIKKVDQDDSLYCKHWNQNIILNDYDSYENAVARLRERLYSVIDKKLKK